MIRKTAERLHEIVAFYLFDIDEETEETKAFSKRFNYLLDKYQLDRADDPDYYEGELSAWEEDKINAVNKELDLLVNKYGDFIKEHIQPLVINNENSVDEDIIDSDDDNEESEETEEAQEEEIDLNLRKANAYKDIAEAGKARAMEDYLKNQENSENASDE